MFARVFIAAASLALAATGASALGLPGGKPSERGAIVVPVVDPPPGAKKSAGPPRAAPSVTRRVSPPVSVRRVTPQVSVRRVAPPSSAKKFVPPVTAKKFTPSSPPVAMKKFTPPLVKGRPVARMPAQFVHVKSHRRHKYYGRIIGGVVIGSILAASAFYAYSSPPEDGLCWYWTNSSRERGYWDYCEPPEDDE